jgi:hypothetical protein
LALVYFSVYFQLIAGILPLFFIKKSNQSNRIIFYYLFSSCLSTVINLTTAYMHINNHMIHNIYLMVSFLLLALFYFLNGRHLLRFFVLIGSGLFYSICFFEHFKTSLLLNGHRVANLVYIIWSLTFFIQSIMKKSNSNLSKTYVLFNASIFIYHTASFFLFTFLWSLVTSNLWYFHNFIEGSSKLLIAYAFWKLPNETNLQDSKT